MAVAPGRVTARDVRRDLSGIGRGDRHSPRRTVTVATLRGAIEVRAMVSRRIRPIQLNGTTVHQVCLPFHFGAGGPFPGGCANDLVGLCAEPNVSIHEGKVCLCALLSERLPKGGGFHGLVRAQVPPEGRTDQSSPGRTAARSAPGRATALRPRSTRKKPLTHTTEQNDEQKAKSGEPRITRICTDELVQSAILIFASGRGRLVPAFGSHWRSTSRGRAVPAPILNAFRPK